MSYYVRILIIVLIINYLDYYPLLVSSMRQSGKPVHIEYVDHIPSIHFSGIVSQRDYDRTHHAYPVFHFHYSMYHSMPCCPSEVLFIFFRSPIIFHDYHYG